MATYTMKSVAEAAGMPYETVRYYCKIGLVPHVGRNAGNQRVFDESHVSWLKGLACLRDCGMGIERMRAYMELCLQGDATIPRRQEMLDAQRAEVRERIGHLESMLGFIDAKQAYYQGILSGEISPDTLFQGYPE